MRTHLSIVFLASMVLALTACNQSSHGSGNDRSSVNVSAADIAEGASPGVRTAEKINEALEAKFGGPIQTEEVESHVPGFRQLVINGEVHYTDPSGRYLLRGEILDLQTGKNLTKISMAKMHASILAGLDPDHAIVFGPNDAEHRITVFTDVECGFCRKFHEQIQEYVDQGIRVNYYPWPRSGLSGKVHDEMVSVWCAKDRKGALTRAKQGKEVPSNLCEEGLAIVDSSYKAGQRLGVRGTPGIFLDNGLQVGGYIPPAEIMSVLDREPDQL